ncbi:hypothetical protein V8E53_009899 [Lactarius tabidus]
MSSVSQRRENLTLVDWLTVFKFIDEHPGIPQTQVVNHFKTCREGALRALYLWVLHMEEEKEMVNGPMLHVKRKRFEELLKVPEEEQLQGEGWIMPFCKAYKLKEYRRHGEAGSVDDQAAEQERKRVQELMKKFAPQDRWNFDETSLFPRAPPDRGLATKHMSGKKNERF